LASPFGNFSVLDSSSSRELSKMKAEPALWGELEKAIEKN
jgi:hypothetical protein